MMLVVRILESAVPLDLGAAGLCRVSLCEVVGVWGEGRIESVVFLGDWCDSRAA